MPVLCQKCSTGIAGLQLDGAPVGEVKYQALISMPILERNFSVRSIQAMKEEGRIVEFDGEWYWAGDNG